MFKGRIATCSNDSESARDSGTGKHAVSALTNRKQGWTETRPPAAILFTLCHIHSRATLYATYVFANRPTATRFARTTKYSAVITAKKMICLRFNTHKLNIKDALWEPFFRAHF